MKNVNTPLKKEDIKHIEKQLGSALPKSYLKKMEEQNGGDIEFNSVAVDFENTWSDEETGLYLPLYEFMPLTIEKYEESTIILNEWGVDGKKMIFAEGEGSYLWYFDFDEHPQNPEIWCLDISDETTHFVAESFEKLLTNLEKRDNDVELTLDDVFADYPSMDEIRETIKSNDDDARFQAYRMWLTRCEDLEGLIAELRQQVESSNDEDELDSYAELLAEVLVNYTDEEFMTYKEAIALFNKKEDVSDLSHVIVQLESEL
nr:SMI1/KNR4 family protein [Exiguobacterium sp. s78]